MQILGLSFVHVISYKPTDLSLLEGFLKNFSFEDFHNCHEICPNGGHELIFLVAMTVINFETLHIDLNWIIITNYFFFHNFCLKFTIHRDKIDFKNFLTTIMIVIFGLIILSRSISVVLELTVKHRTIGIYFLEEFSCF